MAWRMAHPSQATPDRGASPESFDGNYDDDELAIICTGKLRRFLPCLRVGCVMPTVHTSCRLRGGCRRPVYGTSATF